MRIVEGGPVVSLLYRSSVCFISHSFDDMWWQSLNVNAYFNVSVPIGRTNDGLSYPVNPRFDEDGRWRRREEWPEALR